jgi:ATP-dependent Clp protease ATP-binding subunit ClpB
MNLDIYSDRAKAAVQAAQSLALAGRHQHIAPEHLLKVLLEERDGLARQLVTAAGGEPRDRGAKAARRRSTRSRPCPAGTGSCT